MSNPQKYNIPHSTFRPNQLETIEWVLNSNKRINIVSAPTGSGKSTIAAALGSKNQTSLALTSSKSLQDQYSNGYGFVSLKGLNAYPCALNSLFMADSCIHLPQMYNCPVWEECNYIQQRDSFKESDRRSLNYHFFLSAGWLRDYQTDWIVLDEAHKLPRLLMDFLTINLTQKDLLDLDLVMYPVTDTKNNTIRLKLIQNWLNKCVTNLNFQIEKLEAQKKRIPFNKRMGLVLKIARIEQKRNQFQNTIYGIEMDSSKWFSWITPESIKVAPLSAESLFEPFFLEGFDSKILLMSATIGRPELLAQSLGINDYNYREIPSNFTPEERPVYSLKDAPKMGHKATLLAHEKQADSIANSIKSLHPGWSGVIHVNSKQKANQLKSRLDSRGLEHRTYVADGQGTDGKLKAWDKQKLLKRNSICLSYSFDEGVDMGEENFCISADIPFAYLGDPIEKARMDYDPVYFKAEAANKLEQRSGRIRRGRPEDYDTPDKRNGFVAIADQNWNIVKEQLSPDFLSCIKQL